MAERGMCEYKICGCPVAVEKKFCCDHCREVADQDIVEIACDCGCPGPK